MRMTHYFAGLAAACALALIATAVSGIWFAGGELHLLLGLLAGTLAVGLHSLLIVFMIITGKVLRAAMDARPLSGEFLSELNAFFASKRAYPAAVLGAASITAAGVLGYAQRGFGWPAQVHLAFALFALVYNLYAMQIEWRALLDNQQLLDRTARALDELDARDARAAARGELAGALASSAPGALAFERVDHALAARRWLLAALSAWSPYAYWALVVWKGRTADMSPWFLRGSACASLLALILAGLFAIEARALRASASERADPASAAR
jgi:hypothetical protein